MFVSLIKIKPLHNVWAQFDVIVSIKTLQFEANFISELTIILLSGLISFSARETSPVGLWKWCTNEDQVFAAQSHMIKAPWASKLKQGSCCGCAPLYWWVCCFDAEFVSWKCGKFPSCSRAGDLNISAAKCDKHFNWDCLNFNKRLRIILMLSCYLASS